ncbi:MAG: DUF3854 domain-containing protein, partial [Actinomycetes bacterium]
MPVPAAREPASVLYVTEAPLKALSLVSAGYVSVGLGGIYSTLELKNGRHELNDSWEGINLEERPVHVVFDAGRAINPSVAHAEARLAMALEARGAVVSCVCIPLRKDGSDRGPDDFIAEEGVEAFKKLTLERIPADPVKLVETFTAAKTPGGGASAKVLDLCDNLPFWIAVTQRGSGCKERVRAALKAQGFNNKSFDDALRAAEEKLEAAHKSTREEKEKPTSAGPDYRIEDGALVRMKMNVTEEGVTLEPVPLTNFEARIVTQELRDDGQDKEVTFRVAGSNKSGKFPEVILRAEDFEKTLWPMGKWGASAIVYPSTKAPELRAAIQSVSTPTSSLLYTHTGWRTGDGPPAFLHAGGAVGEEGVAVDINPALKRYRLPADRGDVKVAMRASLSLLDVAVDPVSFPIQGAIYRAPLASILPVDTTLWVHGQTGTRKSSVTAVELSHFGDFTSNTLPASWEGTHAALESLLFDAKDLPCVIDDFVPSGSELYDEYQRKAQKLLRAIGNGSARQRMRSDMTARPDRPARGLGICTAEQMPEGASLVARLLPVAVDKHSVNLKKLTRAQETQATLPYAMRGFIEFLRARWETLPDDVNKRFIRLRGEFTVPGMHGRTPAALAHMAVGTEMMLEFAERVGAIDDREQAKLTTRAMKAYRALGQAQKKLVASVEPVDRFLGLLASLLTQGKVTLAVDGAVLKTEHGIEQIGWQDNHYVYLLPDAAHRVVIRAAADARTLLVIDKRTLGKRLRETKALAKHNAGRNLVKASWGDRPPVWMIAKSRLFDSDDGPDGSD